MANTVNALNIKNASSRRFALNRQTVFSATNEAKNNDISCDKASWVNHGIQTAFYTLTHILVQPLVLTLDNPSNEKTRLVRHADRRAPDNKSLRFRRNTPATDSPNLADTNGRKSLRVFASSLSENITHLITPENSGKSKAARVLDKMSRTRVAPDNDEHHDPEEVL